MPRIKRNTLIKGASGNYRGEYVYKVRQDETFIASMPELDPKRPRTDKEIAFRENGISAVAYATGAMANPELKKFYTEKAKSKDTRGTAFNVAFRDFQKKPYVREIDTKKYTGIPASEILVAAYDDCKVTGVTVRIFSAAGVLIEEGPAVFKSTEGSRWVYATTQNNPVLAGSKITAICKDLPGGEGFLDKLL